MKDSHVLFLNPPGKRRYIRDYYCSKVSKAHYMPQPVDLLIQMGFFEEAGYTVHLCDAIIDNLSVQRVFEYIRLCCPRYIVGQIGAVSLDEDRAFYRDLKTQFPGIKLLLSGDVLLRDPQRCFSDFPWLDAIITAFWYDGALQFCEGKSGFGLISKEDIRPARFPAKTGAIRMPRPRHEYFLKSNYSYPFMTHSSMATVLTQFSCPYPCSFCVMSQLDYRVRDPEDVCAELDYLYEKGIRFLYLSDQTFFSHGPSATLILEHMIRLGSPFKWCCFSRVDVLDHDRMMLMKKAGCQVIMFGVEFHDDHLLKAYQKICTRSQIEKTLSLAKRIGIKRMGTFLLGVPGQDKVSIEKTIQFAIDLDLDYASFNCAVPRPLTRLETKLGDGDSLVMDQSGHVNAFATTDLTGVQLQALQRSAYRRFYGRPSYLIKQLRALRTWSQLLTQVKEAMSLFSFCRT